MPNISEELPLIALVGPTNAGKSTFFNRLTGSWQAVTAQEKSTTRDRIYGEIIWQGCSYGIVDTGGLANDETELYNSIQEQTSEAIREADLVLFLYDAKEGLLDNEKIYLNSLRGKNIWLIANKVDTFTREQKITRLNNLGLPYYEVSAATGRGVGDLLDELHNSLPKVEIKVFPEPVIALVGRPNVGKSTLLNSLTHSERSVVSPVAGTTRDVVTENIAINNVQFLLADTAGVRRRGRIEAGPEAFSVKRTIETVAKAAAVLVLIDAQAGTTRGDMHLAYLAKDLRKPVLLVFNKCDLLEQMMTRFKNHLQKFDHIAISAKEQINIDQVVDWISKNVRTSN